MQLQTDIHLSGILSSQIQYLSNSVQKQWVSRVKKQQLKKKKKIFSYKFSQFPPSLYQVIFVSDVTIKGKKKGPSYPFKYFLTLETFIFHYNLFDQVLKFLLLC